VACLTVAATRRVNRDVAGILHKWHARR
jgi:hypothetical protein